MEEKQAKESPVDSLLAPINSKNPIGKDLREYAGSKFYELRTLREALRKQEAQNLLDEKQLGKVSWMKLIEQAQTLLKKQSKDLEVAAWLLEGLLREQNLGGLNNALQTIIGLIEQYWEDFCLRNNNDYEVIVAPIEGLSGGSRDGVLVTPMYMSPVVTLNDGTRITTWDYVLSYEKYSNEGSDSGEVFENILDLEVLREKCASVDAASFVEIDTSIRQSMQLLQQLHTLINEKTEQKWQYSFANLNRVLEKCGEAVHYLGAFAFEKKDVVLDPAQQQALIQTEEVNDLSTISSIDDVRKVLGEIEAFYRKNHPHSPMVHLIKRAADWSTMTLSELIPQMLSDPRTQIEYCRIIGLDPAQLPGAGENNSMLDD
jgi:type VI secretion system protein ImpA